MIVCHCHGTTDRQITGAAQQGLIASPEDVRKSCGAGGGCGGCHATIVRLLSSLGERREEPAGIPGR